MNQNENNALKANQSHISFQEKPNFYKCVVLLGSIKEKTDQLPTGIVSQSVSQSQTTCYRFHHDETQCNFFQRSNTNCLNSLRLMVYVYKDLL